MKLFQDDMAKNEILEVISAAYFDDYHVNIKFSDGSEKLVNFKAFLSKSLHPSISKYLDESLFKKFEIKNGNLNWNDYDLIFPIQDLYEGEIK